MSLKNIADTVLLWIHGRRLGLTSDGQGTQTSAALVLDGVAVGSTRGAVITAVAAGSNGAGAVTVAGATVGDSVISVTRLDTAPADASADFEKQVSVAGQVQQTGSTNRSAQTLLFLVQPGS